MTQSVVNCIIILEYKFKSPEAKSHFKKENKINGLEDACVHLALKVQMCGEKYLKIPKTSDDAGYASCIENIYFTKDLEQRVIQMKKDDFRTQSTFDITYTKILLDYVKEIDSKFAAAPEKEKDWEFEMNYFAIVLLVLAGIGVAVFNMKGKTGSNKETSL